MDRFDDEIEELAAAVIGAAIEVHRHLGAGHHESVYGNALEHELRLRDIPYERERSIQVTYKEVGVGEGRLDFWISGRLVVELKAVPQLSPVYTAQVVSYLAIVNEPVGLLINFNTRVLKDGIKRIVRSATT